MVLSSLTFRKSAPQWVGIGTLKDGQNLSIRCVRPLPVSEDVEHDEMYARTGKEQRHLPSETRFLSHAEAWDKHQKPDDRRQDCERVWLFH